MLPSSLLLLRLPILLWPRNCATMVTSRHTSPRCGVRCWRRCGEGVQKETVVVEEIKEAEMRSRRTQFIYERNYNRIGLQPRGHAPSRLPVKKLRRLLHKGKKVRVFIWKSIRKNIISYYSSPFTNNPQPRRR